MVKEPSVFEPLKFYFNNKVHVMIKFQEIREEIDTRKRKKRDERRKEREKERAAKKSATDIVLVQQEKTDPKIKRKSGKGQADAAKKAGSATKR